MQRQRQRARQRQWQRGGSTDGSLALARPMWCTRPFFMSPTLCAAVLSDHRLELCLTQRSTSEEAVGSHSFGLSWSAAVRAKKATRRPTSSSRVEDAISEGLVGVPCPLDRLQQNFQQEASATAFERDATSSWGSGWRRVSGEGGDRKSVV